MKQVLRNFIEESKKLEAETNLAPIATLSEEKTLEQIDKSSQIYDWLGRLKQIKTTTWLLIAVTAVTFAGRLATMPMYVESRDGIFFTRGVIRYSVAELRPFWPGYPVYMWAGKFFNFFLADPTLALHVLSVVASTLSIWPIAALAKSWRRVSGGSETQAEQAGLAAGIIWALVPLSWLGGSEIFSDPLALLMGLVLLWLSWKALYARKKAIYWLVPAAGLAGLMLGVRMAYVSLILPLLFALWVNRKRKPILLLPGAMLVSFAVGIVWWLGWQLALEGTRFLDLGNKQLAGHYGAWGGSVITDHNLLNRPLRLLETWLVHGVGGWWPNTPLQRLIPTAGLLALLFLGSWKLVRSPRREAWLMPLLWAGTYLGWTLLNYDVDLARYSFPLVAMACILAGIGVSIFSKYSYLVLLGIALAVGLVTVPLALEHQTNPPIGQKLASYLNDNLDPSQAIIVITDDVPYQIFFVQEFSPAFQSTRILAENIDKQVKELAAQGRAVYALWLPNKAPQSWTVETKLTRGQFMESRGPLEVWLYKYGG